MSTDRDPRALRALTKLFVRASLGGARVSPGELQELWEARESLSLRRRVAKAQEKDGEEVSVDGDPMSLDWGEPAWDSEKKKAVRACLMNDPESLPQVGQILERAVYKPGTVDFYFADGSFVSAQVIGDEEESANCGCNLA